MSGEASEDDVDLRPYVRICRGCCCGSQKHPDFDHEAQVEAISEVARVRIVGCVDECSMSNVMLAQFGDEKAQWIGNLTSEQSTDDLIGWLQAGGGPPNIELADHFFDPVAVRKARLTR